MKLLKRNSLILLCVAMLSGAGTASAQGSSYRLITAPIDQEAAAKKKEEILQLSSDLFTAGTFSGGPADTIRYRLLAPSVPVAGRKYPMILIFHNSGRIGTDNTAQLDVLVKYWAQADIRSRYPAYVVAVQFPLRSSNYSPVAGDVLSSAPDPCLQRALQLADSLKKALPVDQNRIYSLGFSMGASTANNALMLRPELFAAGLCISGIPMQENADRLRHIPLWLLHGNKDTDNPIPGDRALYQKISSFKDARILFWEIEGLEHKIYAPLYTTIIMPEWLWAQKRNAAGPGRNRAR